MKQLYTPALPDGYTGHTIKERTLKECAFHDHTMQFDVNSGCRLMADENLIDELTDAEAKRFIVACLGYPHLYRAKGSVPGGCCYDWHTTQ